jgi:hypothetical protein
MLKVLIALRAYASLIIQERANWTIQSNWCRPVHDRVEVRRFDSMHTFGEGTAGFSRYLAGAAGWKHQSTFIRVGIASAPSKEKVSLQLKI